MDPISTILTVGTTLINRLFPDKTEAEKAKLKLLEMQQSGDLKEVELAMNAIVAEASSQDKWTSRARPSFLYVIYLIILFSIPMGILGVWNPDMVKNIELGFQGWLHAIPEGLWALFGAGYLGYSASRSFDKRTLSKNNSK